MSQSFRPGPRPSLPEAVTEWLAARWLDGADPAVSAVRLGGGRLHLRDAAGHEFTVKVTLKRPRPIGPHPSPPPEPPR